MLDLDQSEKLYLQRLQHISRLTDQNKGNIFHGNLDMCLVYMYKDNVMAYNYAESEILNIFDAKKDYYQDELYFEWLNHVP